MNPGPVSSSPTPSTSLDALKYLGIVGEDADSITLTIQEGRAALKKPSPLKGMNEEEIFAAAILQVEPGETPATAARGLLPHPGFRGWGLFLQYNTCQEAEDLPMAEFVGTHLRCPLRRAVHQGDPSTAVQHRRRFPDF